MQNPLEANLTEVRISKRGKDKKQGGGKRPFCPHVRPPLLLNMDPTKFQV